jgi:tetratricopeptide (TPR) repeat protein
MSLKPILWLLALASLVGLVCGQQVPADGWYLKGDELYTQGRYYEAVEAYDRAIQFNPGHMLAYHSIGSCYHDIGAGERGLSNSDRAAYLHVAIYYYDMATRLDPDNAPSWGNAALAFYQLGMYRDYQRCQNEYNRLNRLAGKKTTVTYRQNYHIPGVGNVVIEPTYEFTYNPSQSVTPGRVEYR